MDVSSLIQEFSPLTIKELLLIKRILLFARDRAERKQSGRLEIHFDNNGKLDRVHLLMCDRV